MACTRYVAVIVAKARVPTFAVLRRRCVAALNVPLPLQAKIGKSYFNASTSSTRAMEFLQKSNLASSIPTSLPAAMGRVWDWRFATRSFVNTMAASTLKPVHGALPLPSYCRGRRVKSLRPANNCTVQRMFLHVLACSCMFLVSKFSNVP